VGPSSRQQKLGGKKTVGTYEYLLAEKKAVRISRGKKKEKSGGSVFFWRGKRKQTTNALHYTHGWKREGVTDKLTNSQGSQAHGPKKGERPQVS